MSRIHIGNKNGRMGVWVAAPGYDASSEGGKMMLDSDRSSMQFHYSPPPQTVNGVFDGSAYFYDSFWIEFDYPTLGYIPLAFAYVRHSNYSGNAETLFPRSNLIMWGDYGGYAPLYRFQVSLTQVRLILPSKGTSDGQVTVYVDVYKNRAIG